MLERKQNIRIIAPMLDRLIDTDQSRSQFYDELCNLNDIYQMIRRDLEYLLNTRAPNIAVSKNYKEVSNSVMNYGLPDFTSVDYSSNDSREELCREIQKIIERDEPRLSKVRVIWQHDEEMKARTLNLRIEAEIRLAPEYDRVVFESSLDPVKHIFTIQKQRSMR